VVDLIENLVENKGNLDFEKAEIVINSIQPGFCLIFLDEMLHKSARVSNEREFVRQ
jgi:hypothetical protein